MTRAIALTAALIFGPAAPAAAVVLQLDDGTQRPQPYQAWADRAKAPTPRVVIALHLAACPDTGGAACSAPGHIWIDPSRPVSEPKMVFLHELGHHFDYEVMSDSARDTFRFLFDNTSAWRAPIADPPVEKFAEGWATCAHTRQIERRWYGAYRYRPRPPMHARVCRLIRWTADGRFT